MKVTEEELKELRYQLFRANDQATRIVYKQKTSELTQKELKKAVALMQDNIVSRGKKVTKTHVQEFSDFYILQYDLAPHDYILDGKVVDLDC